jgi:hypothetical protein
MSRAAVATSFFLASLTALMLFAATPVAAEGLIDAINAQAAGDSHELLDVSEAQIKSNIHPDSALDD